MIGSIESRIIHESQENKNVDLKSLMNVCTSGEWPESIEYYCLELKNVIILTIEGGQRV